MLCTVLTLPPDGKVRRRMVLLSKILSLGKTKLVSILEACISASYIDRKRSEVSGD
jgi:hypothetical protein